LSIQEFRIQELEYSGIQDSELEYSGFRNLNIQGFRIQDSGKIPEHSGL
jgi:hypothetical protein